MKNLKILNLKIKDDDFEVIVLVLTNELIKLKSMILKFDEQVLVNKNIKSIERIICELRTGKLYNDV